MFTVATTRHPQRLILPPKIAAWVLIGLVTAGCLHRLGRSARHRPTDTDADTTSFPRIGTVLVALALASAVLVSGAIFTAQASFENDVNSAVGDVLDDEAYGDLELAQTSVEFVVVPGFEPPDVQVVIHRPVGVSYPRLAAEPAEAVRTATDREVNVQVEFVDVQRFDAEG